MVNCWLHIVWSTKNRFPYFSNSEKSKQCKIILEAICREKGIYVSESYVNPEHIHILINLPADTSIKAMMQNLKGISSHEINSNEFFKTTFCWARGYAAFSVSSSAVEKVAEYIRNQEQHHRHKSFAEEWDEFLQEYERVINR